MGVDMVMNYFADIVGHMRYNFFIILYPVGITGELICCYKTWEYFKALGPAESRPSWTYYPMPNKFNISFIYEDVIFVCIPLFYILGFPGLYKHMWVQRSKHYKSR
jgi:very-long-chain (3R)-3-hydroxyacyl-CoA dehydratase